jgi:hypothetical protein
VEHRELVVCDSQLQHLSWGLERHSISHLCSMKTSQHWGALAGPAPRMAGDGSRSVKVQHVPALAEPAARVAGDGSRSVKV